jgi:hypothetical protein
LSTRDLSGGCKHGYSDVPVINVIHVVSGQQIADVSGEAVMADGCAERKLKDDLDEED